MNSVYQLSKSQMTPVTVSASTVTKISESSTTTPGRKLFTFPVDAGAGTVFVMAVKADESAPSSSVIQQYGAPYTSADKVAQIATNELHDIYAYTTAGTTVYPQEWV